MSRSVSAVTSVALAQDTTRPIYLIRMGWTAASPDVTRRIATWDTDLSWNSETWTASGAEVSSLSPGGGTLQLPNGDADPWLSLVTTQIPRGRAIDIYEYHTSWGSPSGSDAEHIFSGLMDDCEITPSKITIGFIDGLLNKVFPVTSIDPTVYTHLLATGQRLYWGPDIVMVE